MPKSTATTKQAQSTEKPLIIPNTVITLTASWKQVEPEYKKTLNRLAKRLNLDGFRKGMVPPHIAEKNLKPEAIVEPVLQKLLPDIYVQAVKAQNKQPVSDPEFQPKSLKKNEDWIIDAHIAEAPQIDVKDYKKIVSSAKKNFKQKPPAKNEQPKSSDTAESTEKSIQSEQLDSIYQELIKNYKPQIPELLVTQQTRRELERLVQELRRAGTTLQDFLERNNQSFESLSQNIAARSVGQLQLDFLLESITAEAKIVVEEEEVTSFISETKDEALQKQQLADTRYKAMVKNYLLRKKLSDHLLSV